MADGLGSGRSGGPRMVVVEPRAAACVAHALALGRAERIEGELETSAEMLSCGLVSEPALRRLFYHDAQSLLVDDSELLHADALLASLGLASTPSGAAGLAGIHFAAADLSERDRLGLVAESRVMLVVSERSPGPRGPAPPLLNVSDQEGADRGRRRSLDLCRDRAPHRLLRGRGETAAPRLLIRDCARQWRRRMSLSLNARLLPRLKPR